MAVFVARWVLAPVQLYWSERERADELKQELEAARGQQSGASIGPDWPLHELFYHIDPNLLDDANEAAWERIGNDLRDAFSVGRLKVWGRSVQDGIGKMLGERPALTPIETSYWWAAHFTYSFFDETAGDAPHTYTDKHSGLPDYTDLQVNRTEALKLWPGEPADIAESYPNIRVADSAPVLELFDGAERAKLIALLTAEKLSCWVRVSASNSHDYVRLEGKSWKTHNMLFIPKSPEPGTINQTYFRPKGTHNSMYYDVCLNYSQLKRAWPALSIRRMKCGTL